MMRKYSDIYHACREMTKDRLLTPSLVVDLGARHGEGLEAFASSLPSGSVYYMIEPSPRCFPHVIEAMERFSRSDIITHILDGALTSKSGTRMFHLLDDDDDQSGNLFSDRSGRYGPSIPTPVKTYDHRSVLPVIIDFAKVNIEGGEYELIDTGFFDKVESFVMEVHNEHVPNMNIDYAINMLTRRFDLELWGERSYKYCFLNGKRKS